MAPISGHLPRLGALVLAVVVAAVAYSVYESGQSTGSTSASPAPRSAGLPAADPTNDSTKAPKPKAKPKPKPGRDSNRPQHTADGGVPIVASELAFAPDSGAGPGPGGPVLRPVATKPPVSTPEPGGGNRGGGNRGGGNGLDRELRRLIDGPSPKPKSPEPKPVAPAPSPNAPAPGGSAPTAAPPAPAPAADPEAGLDDTPVGGLDPNDLGEPTDETNTPVPVAPPPAPAPGPRLRLLPLTRTLASTIRASAASIRRIPADRWTPRPPAPLGRNDGTEHPYRAETWADWRHVPPTARSGGPFNRNNENHDHADWPRRSGACQPDGWSSPLFRLTSPTIPNA